MSITIDSYSQNGIYVTYRWDKYKPHYEVIVSKRETPNSPLRNISYNRYDEREKAQASFEQQVAKVKKGDF